MDMPDVGVAISSGAVGSIVTALIAWWNSKKTQPRKIEPQPLGVEGEIAKKPAFVTVQECNRRMCEMREDVKLIAGGQEKIISKLDEIDKRSEERAIALNRRVDPMLEKLAETKGRVDMIGATVREAARAATIGGKK
jgi:hypothetical protein